METVNEGNTSTVTEIKALETRVEKVKTTIDFYNLRYFLGLLLFIFSVVPNVTDYVSVWISLALIFYSAIDIKINKLKIRL